MKLNPMKCCNIIFNFSKKKQFATNMKIKDDVIETVQSKKLLGTSIEDKMKWNLKIERSIKAANKRMVLLHKVSKFTSRISDLKLIYNSKIRGILETSCDVWHSSLTLQQRASLERLQNVLSGSFWNQVMNLMKMHWFKWIWILLIKGGKSSAWSLPRIV